MIKKFTKDPMQYTLITKTGRVMTFYIQEVAEMYQSIYGGQLVTAEALYNKSNSCYNSSIKSIKEQA